MFRTFGLGLAVVVLLASAAIAVPCTTYPNLLTNNTVADADQVMANLTYMSGCLAPLASPAFTGAVSVGGATVANAKLYVNGDPGYSSGLSIAVAAAPTWASGSLTSGGPVYDASFSLTGSSTVPFVAGYQASGGTTGGTSSITNYYAFYSPAWTGNITNRYAFRAAGGSGSNSYGVYVDSAKSYFGGAIGLGTTTPLDKVTILDGGLRTDTSNTTNVDRLSFYEQGTWSALAEWRPSGASSPTLFRLGTVVSAPIVFIAGGVESMRLTSAGNFGIGTATPAQKLEVNGQIKFDTLASGPGTNLCYTGTYVLSSCSSSIRYKKNVEDAPFGLKEVLAMRPVSFRWKANDESDFGFIAEEMAKIDPRFATYKDGKIEGVKYPQLSAVLVNAIKELKAANDAQQIVNGRQAAALRALREENADLMSNNRRQLKALLSAITSQATATRKLEEQIGILRRAHGKSIARTARN